FRRVLFRSGAPGGRTGLGDQAARHPRAAARGPGGARRPGGAHRPARRGPARAGLPRAVSCPRRPARADGGGGAGTARPGPEPHRRRAPHPVRPAPCPSTPARPRPSWANIRMSTALPSDLVEDPQTAGYFQQPPAGRRERLLRTARPVADLVRPETTFDGPEVRRHLTVVVLTDTHLLVTHLDDDPADALNPSQVVSTTERIRLRSITATGLSQVFDTDGKGSPDT